MPHNLFESIRHVNEHEQEYWSARELYQIEMNGDTKKESIASNTSKTTTKPSVPLEMDEGIFLANWLRSSAYIFSHIVNEG